MANIIPVTSMIDRMPDFNQTWRQGVQWGQEQKERGEAREREQTVRNLAPQVVAGDPAAFGQVAAINPKAAGELQQAGDGQLKRFKGFIGHIDKAREQAKVTGDWRHVNAALQQASPYLSQLLGKPGPTEWPQGDPQWEAGWEGLKARLEGVEGSGPQGRVQSTYIDAQGQRVAIMADGSTQILGQNAPNNQIIDTGNGFYGVNKGSLNAAPVVIGSGQPAPQPQPSAPPPGGLYNTPAGPVRIEGGMSPEDWQVIQADVANRGGSDQYTLPQRDVSPAQYGGQQLRSAPKPQAAPAGYRTLPDGSMEPIPGGPAQIAIDARNEAAAARQAADDAKRAQKAQGEAARQAEAATAANQLVSAIDGLMQHPGFGALGTAWGDAQIMTPLIRNDAKDAKARLENISGQVALSTMARLKSLSSTGATGFGSLTAPELKLLQNSIDTLQSENISNEQLAASLKNIRDFMDKTANWKPQQGMDFERGAPQQAPANDIDALLDLYR